jgi:hypothetical protein
VQNQALALCKWPANKKSSYEISLHNCLIFFVIPSGFEPETYCLEEREYVKHIASKLPSDQNKGSF